MYVFPGIGLGAILCKSVNVTQDMIYASGEYLSRSLTPEEKEASYLYPDITRIRDVSVVVTRGVIRAAQQNGVDRELSIRNLNDEQLDEYIRQRMYDPFREADGIKSEIAEMVAKRTTGLHSADFEVPKAAAAGAHL
jgi:malate dehydrogenase (oxaloacetate-decarboxylating)(NADP+)